MSFVDKQAKKNALERFNGPCKNLICLKDSPNTAVECNVIRLKNGLLAYIKYNEESVTVTNIENMNKLISKKRDKMQE